MTRTPEQIQHLKELVAALRSGKYKQGTNHLRPNDGSGGHRYCCLGVACDISGLGRWRPQYGGKTSDPYQVFNKYGGQGEVEGGVLPPSVQHYFGIDAYGHFGAGGADSLVTMNDTGRSFDEIAAAIEEKFINGN